MAGILLLPPPMAIAAAGLGMCLDLIRLREPWSRVLFNTANTVATVGLSALLANITDVHGTALADGGVDDVAGFFVVAFGYYVINSMVLAGVMALAQARPFWNVYWTSARSSAPAEIAVSVIGGLAVFIWLTNPPLSAEGLRPNGTTALR